MDTLKLSAADLRNEIAEALEATIDLYRSAKSERDSSEAASGPVTDEEIDDFLLANPLLDPELAYELMEPGLLGFHVKMASVPVDAYEDFREAVSGWVTNNSWLAADGPIISPAVLFGLEPDSSQLWLPESEARPGWLNTSPSAILAAQQLIERGKLLSDLNWREFEKLIAELLEAEMWKVELMRGTRDGGIDVIATKSDSTIGHLKTLWQAKRYDESRKVRLAQARELSGVLERDGATKGVLVTTSSFTKGAIDWVRQDEFRLSAKDSEDVKAWIARHC